MPKQRSECTVEGCDKPHWGKGFCRNHYERWKRNGDPLVNKRPGGLCTVDGCNRKRQAQTLCGNHYIKWRRWGDPLAGPGKGSQPKPLAPRFWSKVEKTDGCWLWIGGRYGNSGYGRFWVDGRNVLAHRFAYEYLVGPIPRGLTIDHVAARGCTSRLCVNPSHLEAVTHRENNLRSDGVGGRNARKTHCSHGHPYDAENTVVYRGSRYCLTCQPGLRPSG